MFPRAYARVVVLRVLKVLRILGDKNSNKINILEGVWWKDMGCMVEGYGVYGGRIWGVWWKDMGCRKIRALLNGGKIWGRGRKIYFIFSTNRIMLHFSLTQEGKIWSNQSSNNR